MYAGSVYNQNFFVARNRNRAFKAGVIELYHKARVLEGGLGKRGTIPALRENQRYYMAEGWIMGEITLTSTVWNGFNLCLRIKQTAQTKSGRKQSRHRNSAPLTSLPPLDRQSGQRSSLAKSPRPSILTISSRYRSRACSIQYTCGLACRELEHWKLNQFQRLHSPMPDSAFSLCWESL